VLGSAAKDKSDNNDAAIRYGIDWFCWQLKGINLVTSSHRIHPAALFAVRAPLSQAALLAMKAAEVTNTGQLGLNYPP